MGRKNHRLRLESVALGRSCYCLLIRAVQLEANRQADVLVDTLHCKTEQFGPQYCVSWESSWPRAGLLTLLG